METLFGILTYFLSFCCSFEWIVSVTLDTKRATQMIVTNKGRPLFFARSAVGGLIPSGLVG